MEQGGDNPSYCNIGTMTEENIQFSRKRQHRPQNAKLKQQNAMDQDDDTNFYDIGKMSPDMEQFSMEVPEGVCKIIKMLKRRVQIPLFLVVFGVSSVGILATLLGAGNCSYGKGVSDLLQQGAATKAALQKAGQVQLALTLDHKFEADMAIANSRLYQSTQTKLCGGIHQALVRYKRFPKQARTDCELESLREINSRIGAVKVTIKLTVTGSYTIPANSVYVKAVTSYVRAVKTLGSFTVINGSVSVVASSYTLISTTTPLPSTTAAPPSTTAEPIATYKPSYPQTEMYMGSSVGGSSKDHNVTCNTHHAPLDWTELRIKSIHNDDIQAVAYPNGSTNQTTSLFRVGLTHRQNVVSLDMTFPRTTSCKADGSYVCVLIANRTIIKSATAMVTITEDVSNLHISGNTTINEGDRYMINCTATLPRENGHVDLYIKTVNDTEFITSAERPFTVLDDVDDVCHHTVTKTYMFLAGNSQNGTEMKCVATAKAIPSAKDSEGITITVVPADFSTVFHLNNATWIPAYSDANSPEFQHFAESIEHDTDYVYDRSSVKDNYKGSKVVRLSKMNGIAVDMAIRIDLSIALTDSSNNVIRTELNANDILGAFVKTLPMVTNQLPSRALATVDTKELVGDVFVGDNHPADGCDAKTDMIFVLDASGSIGLNNFAIMKYFIQNFTATVDIGTNALQIGVVKFDSHVYNEFWLNTYDSPRQIANAVNQVNYTAGGTYLDTALKYTRQNAFTTEHGARNGAGRVIIVMTDGVSSDDPDQVAATLKREGVVIVSIGIGAGVNQRQLLSIAYNSTFVFQVNDFNVLINIKKIVQSSTCAVAEPHQQYD